MLPFFCPLGEFGVTFTESEIIINIVVGGVFGEYVGCFRLVNSMRQIYTDRVDESRDVLQCDAKKQMQR